MDEIANVRLSAEEAELVRRGDWILTKNNILRKADALLGAVQEQQAAILASCQHRLPFSHTAYSPKLSRGENYKGLPYRVLDYPRLFEQENIFAVRSIFWWGHFFSSTLLLSGLYQQQYAGPVSKAYNLWAENDYYLCTHTDSPWEHHFESDNYTAIKAITPAWWEEVIAQKSFIKIAKRFDLAKWDECPGLLQESFRLYLTVLAG